MEIGAASVMFYADSRLKCDYSPLLNFLRDPASDTEFSAECCESELILDGIDRLNCGPPFGDLRLNNT